MNIRRTRTGGFTLVEMNVSMAIFLIFSIGISIESIFLHKTFSACQQSTDYSNQQLRITNYISLDLRNATAVQLASNGDLTLTLPNFYNTDGLPNNPQISGSTIVYGTGSVTVKYYRRNNNLYRSCSNPQKVITIAEGIADLTCIPTDYGQSIAITTSFTPRFQWNNKANLAAKGNVIYTTTLLRNQRSKTTS